MNPNPLTVGDHVDTEDGRRGTVWDVGGGATVYGIRVTVAHPLDPARTTTQVLDYHHSKVTRVPRPNISGVVRVEDDTGDTYYVVAGPDALADALAFAAMLDDVYGLTWQCAGMGV